MEQRQPRALTKRQCAARAGRVEMGNLDDVVRGSSTAAEIGRRTRPHPHGWPRVPVAPRRRRHRRHDLEGELHGRGASRRALGRHGRHGRRPRPEVSTHGARDRPPKDSPRLPIAGALGRCHRSVCVAAAHEHDLAWQTIRVTCLCSVIAQCVRRPVDVPSVVLGTWERRVGRKTLGNPGRSSPRLFNTAGPAQASGHSIGCWRGSPS